MHASGGGSEFVAVNLGYPVGDLLLFGLTILGIVILPRGKRMRWYLIGAAGAINAAGDIAALFNGLAATNIGWFLNVIAWPSSLFLISCAVWLVPDPDVPVRENDRLGLPGSGRRLGAGAADPVRRLAPVTRARWRSGSRPRR